jgi:hypothetical protein
MSRLARYLTTLFVAVAAVAGKNRYNKAAINWTSGYFISSTGVVTAEGNYSYSDLIPILPETEYVAHGMIGQNGSPTRIHEYDSGGTWIKQFGYATGLNPVVTGTTSATTAYLRISTYTAGINEDAIQIEAGSTPTAYEPYSG